MPIPGISGKTVSNEVAAGGQVSQVEYVPTKHDMVNRLIEVCRPGDLLITMGAGDITTIGPDFVEAKQALDEGAHASCTKD